MEKKVDLSREEMLRLYKSVFPHLEQDERIAVLVDLPNKLDEDNGEWQARRKIAFDWKEIFVEIKKEINIQQVDLIAYPRVSSNNADLPDRLYICDGEISVEENVREIFREDMFASYQVFLVLSEYSATAPMKLAAKKYLFRAATMSGFSNKMLSALRIDYELVSHRLELIKEKLDKAENVNVCFIVEGQKYEMNFDLRDSCAHVSSGRFPEKGMVGNLPSGETYIVPNERENSETAGILPVQFDNEVVLYEIKKNQVYNILSKGPKSEQEALYVKKEPAYGNIAELGFGILSDFGITPIGEVLLDEKLGFHIAFGRSDHFGGRVGPSSFSCPEAVIHIDYVYIESTQPLVNVSKIASSETIIQDGKYSLWERI